MYSSHIAKVEKAARYAQERERVSITNLKATFRGDHNIYEVTCEEGRWRCSCPFFASREFCSHTMALERMLEGMVPRPPSAEDSTPQEADIPSR